MKKAVLLGLIGATLSLAGTVGIHESHSNVSQPVITSPMNSLKMVSHLGSEIVTPTIAHADPTKNMENPELELDSDTGLGYFISQINTYTSSTLPKQDTDARPFTMFSSDKVEDSIVLYMNKKGYNQNGTKQKQAVLQYLYKTLDASEMNERDKNRLDNWIQANDQANSTVVKSFKGDTSTNLVAAQKIISPFSGPLGTILGVLSLCIALALTFSFVWDIAFLSIPFFQTFLMRGGQGTIDIDHKPFLVSQDAMLAYNDGMSENRQVLSVWMKYRSKSVIIIGLCLTYLISNQIWDLVAFLIDIFGRWLGQ